MSADDCPPAGLARVPLPEITLRHVPPIGTEVTFPDGSVYANVATDALADNSPMRYDLIVRIAESLAHGEILTLTIPVRS